MTDSQPISAKKEEKSKKAAGAAPLFLIFLTVLIDLIGFGIIIPVMPTYAEQLHATDWQVGILIASYSLTQFLFMPFWGRLSDKVGRKPILLTSLAASALGYLIWGMTDSLLGLFISRLIAGAGNANIAVAQAYVSDVTTEETRAKGMGLIGAAFGLGFVLGPALGGLFAHYGLSTIGFIAFGLSLFDLILTALILPEPQKRSSAGTERFPLDPRFIVETLRSERLSASMLIFFISTFAFANMEATLVLLTQKQYAFSPRDNSLMFTYIGFWIIMVQGGMIHRLARKYGEKKLISIGTFLVAVGLLMTPFMGGVFGLGVALAVLAVGSGLNNPSNQSMISKLSPVDRTGGVLGVGQSVSTLGRIIGPAVGGFAFQYAGMSSPYVIGAVAMVVAFLISLRLPEVQPK